VVFVGDDEVGNAFAAALRRRYADQPLPERKRSYRLRGYYLHRKVSDGARDDLAAAGAWCWSAAPEHRAGPVRDD
jgi:hypothetical protein